MCNRIVLPRSDEAPPLSRPSATTGAVIMAMTFSASGAAPTPLFRTYQESFGLNAFMLTVIFSAYVLSLLGALLTVGSISDFLGRKPAGLVALTLNIVSMGIFIDAQSAVTLIAARAIQGFATGLATATFGAAILDLDRERGPILNSVTAFFGLSFGSLGSAALVAYAPDPRHLVYIILLTISVGELAFLFYMPETVAAKAGALLSLRPHINVPPKARKALIAVTPVTIASWALGGFYFSLMPMLVRTSTGINSSLIGGLVVSALTLSGALTVLAFRQRPALDVLRNGTFALILGVAATLLGVSLHSISIIVTGTILAGTGFGAAFAGAIRTVMVHASPHERAGLLAAFYIEGYLSFCIPAILAGLVIPLTGIGIAADLYGSLVIILSMISLIIEHRSNANHSQI